MSVQFVLALIALFMTIAAPLGFVPLWIPVLLICIILLVGSVPATMIHR